MLLQNIATPEQVNDLYRYDLFEKGIVNVQREVMDDLQEKIDSPNILPAEKKALKASVNQIKDAMKTVAFDLDLGLRNPPAILKDGLDNRKGEIVKKALTFFRPQLGRNVQQTNAKRKAEHDLMRQDAIQQMFLFMPKKEEAWDTYKTRIKNLGYKDDLGRSMRDDSYFLKKEQRQKARFLISIYANKANK